MNTIIFKWNPAISNMSTKGLGSWIESANNFVYAAEGTWSAYDHENISEGDRFYFLVCGSRGANGIIGCGEIIGNCHQDDDWAGSSKPKMYAPIRFDILFSADVLPPLPTTLLTQEIPNFQWIGGHSGVIMNNDDAEKLDKFWKEHLDANSDDFERVAEKEAKNSKGRLFWRDKTAESPVVLFNGKYQDDSDLRIIITRDDDNDLAIYHHEFFGPDKKQRYTRSMCIWYDEDMETLRNYFGVDSDDALISAIKSKFQGPQAFFQLEELFTRLRLDSLE